MMEADRSKAQYEGSAGSICIDFEPTAHQYGIGPDFESLDLVPSVSDITEFIPKWLTAWGQGIGVKGVLEILRQSCFDEVGGVSRVDLSRLPVDDPKAVIQTMKKMGLDHDAVRQSAADRGTMVHSAFRGWIVNGIMPNPDDYSTGEAKGYIRSLQMFCEAMEGKIKPIVCEEPLCSPTLGLAGTPDLFAEVDGAKVQTGGNASKRPNFGTADGLCLIDLKTSAQVYMSHAWQLSFYHRFLEECGFPPPTERVIVLIKANGEGFNWKPQQDRLGALRSLVDVFNAEKRPEGWKHWSAPENHLEHLAKWDREVTA